MLPDTLQVLGELRDSARRMAEHYGKSDEKVAQNAALVAAGLAPIHSETLFRYDAERRAEHLRHIKVLDALIAELGPRPASYLYLGKAGAAIARLQDEADALKSDAA